MLLGVIPAELGTRPGLAILKKPHLVRDTPEQTAEDLSDTLEAA